MDIEGRYHLDIKGRYQLAIKEQLDIQGRYLEEDSADPERRGVKLDVERLLHHVQCLCQKRRCLVQVRVWDSACGVVRFDSNICRVCRI